MCNMYAHIWPLILFYTFYTNAIPANITIFDKISSVSEKCPSLLQNILVFDPLATCKNLAYRDVTLIPSLVDGTRNEILCHVFLENFETACNNVVPKPNDFKLPPNAYPPEGFCNKLTFISNTSDGQYIKRVFLKDSPRICEQFCHDYTLNVEPICTLAYRLNEMSSVGSEKKVVAGDILPAAVHKNVANGVEVAVADVAEPPLQPAPVQGSNKSEAKQTVETTGNDTPTREQNVLIPDPKPDNKTLNASAVIATTKDASVPAKAATELTEGGKPPTNENDRTGNNKNPEDIEPGDNVVVNPNENIPPQDEEEEIPPPTKSSTTLTSNGDGLKLGTEKKVDDDFEDSNGEAMYISDKNDENSKVSGSVVKPSNTNDEAVTYSSNIDGDSYFFSYFMMLCIVVVLAYVGYHNKQKIRAIVIEGPRGRRQYRGRRPNSASYHKLDSNLEEAISSTCTKNSSQIIY